jgi:hypothetical protein
MLEMAELLFRRPDDVPSSEAAHVALFFANVAWNECVGLGGLRDEHRNVWESIEAEKPDLWNEFKSSDVHAMIDELAKYKKHKYADDGRRIILCGMLDGKIRVEWLPPAATGDDPKCEPTAFGLVRSGDRRGAIRYLQQTCRLTRTEAERRVARIGDLLRKSAALSKPKPAK